jgi:hypothetical protein
MTVFGSRPGAVLLPALGSPLDTRRWVGPQRVTVKDSVIVAADELPA